MANVRRPVVAGTFYEANAESLKAQIENCFLSEFGPQKIPMVNPEGSRELLGIISPHAGYLYSGPIAAQAFNEMAQDGKPDTVIILGPNHTGYGSALSIMKEGSWRTPLGDVEIDSFVAEDIIKEAKIIDVDETAHRSEHSIEVQLPFLQYLYGDSFKMVPICFMMQDLETAMDVGRALVEALVNRNVIVVASSDFTHYETAERVNRKDLAAIKAIENLDTRTFYSVLRENNITACGYAPIAALMTYAKGLCAKEVTMLSHINSGDVIGDHSSVVGYAAITFKNGTCSKTD
jgi:AmmeMemoRadiSam system protein B